MATTLLPALLLLTLLKMTTISESLSEQSPRLTDPESCSPKEYKSAGHCCELCPAGEYVGKPCVTPHTPGTCVKCGQGTFTNSANGLDSCCLCTTCRDDQEMVTNCSSTQNRVCQCQTGRFYQDLQDFEHCTPCSKCPKGKLVLRKCNATADTVCSLAAPNRRNWLWILSVVLTQLLWSSSLS
uniref:Tumor necrosis factor receptor superfamily member 23-like n=1 Tax=Castor canadensis TaxID=51338 RepID=A0A8B7V143_CASCN|nr:tumor necrosis factor receptor superfamily member 23-like [Castor canadensis]